MGYSGFVVREDYRLLSHESFQHNASYEVRRPYFNAHYRYCHWDEYEFWQDKLVDYIEHAIDHRMLSLEDKIKDHLERHRILMKRIAEDYRENPDQYYLGRREMPGIVDQKLGEHRAKIMIELLKKRRPSR